MPSSASFWKKNLFSLKNNAILHNRVILYFIFLVSLGNLFYLSVERDITSIVVFLLVGFLTSFFSKNMLIILFVALLTSTIIKHGAGLRHEGLENMVDPPEDSDYAQEPAEDEDLSNEVYLEKDENEMPRNRKIENYEGGYEDEEDEEVEVEDEEVEDEDVDDIVENYEGEDSKTKNSKNVNDSKVVSDAKKLKTDDKTITACVRKCLGM